MATYTTTYEIGEGLKVVDGKKLEVDTVDVAEKGNQHPITSNGVAKEIGDLDSLLNVV